MNKFSALATLACALFLGGCATAPVVMDSASLLKPGYGVVAASFQFTAYATWGDKRQHPSEMPHMRADIVPVDDAPGGDMAVLASGSGWRNPGKALATAAGNRVMDVEAVKPGRYKIRRLETSFTFANKTSSELLSKDIVFEVKEGEVTYIGSIQAVAGIAGNGKGELVPTSILMSVRDEFADDVASMKKIDPGMEKLVVKDGLRP